MVLFRVTYYHGLRLTLAHDNSVIFSTIATISFLAIELAASFHEVIVDFLSVTEQVTAREFFAFNWKATVQSVIGLREDSDKKGDDCEEAGHLDSIK